MYSRREPRSFGGFGGLTGPPIPDLLVLIVVLFTTWTLQFFSSTAAIPALLRLWPAALTGPYLWQLLTYPFVGFGSPDLWFLLELLILYWFAADVFRRLGRARFWRVILVAAVTSALVTTSCYLLLTRLPLLPSTPLSFPLMQGQRVLLTVVTVAFALLFADATILLFFVLPMPARYFLWFPVVLGFVAFLQSRDLAGLVGLCTAVAVTWLQLRRRGPGGWRPLPRLKRWWHEQRLRRLRRRSGLRVLDRDGDGPDLTIN